MKNRKHHGSRPHNQQGHQKGKHHNRPQSGHKPRDRRWQPHHPQGQAAQRSQKICPMCGATVPNLASHIREKHDDTESHPVD